MGRKNYLIEGGSGTGKTSVCMELRRRGYHAINGDRELAYQGDPETGEPVAGITGVAAHAHHLWRVDEVRAEVADQREALTFFCGGSRNLAKFIDLFDAVFVLEVDLETLNRRLDGRPQEEWGGRAAERILIERLYRTREEIPACGIMIDATAPLGKVVDDILRRVHAAGPA
ncbi:nucleoside kinase [Arthrobacter liuii]|uniref:Nucleoside kinase n=1 Tax=Arthrobacter liuii TaxID=1476996 RepID=A0ABQ2AHR6_9MICC|nr:nucleoside kinase [Arthrobacter liuii]GGH91722.1 nucleoside kinase [Arthrobacter liuii]